MRCHDHNVLLVKDMRRGAEHGADGIEWEFRDLSGDMDRGANQHQRIDSRISIGRKYH